MKNKRIGEIISIIYIIIITFFSFDEKFLSVPFLIHLIPTVIFLGLLVFAYFKPKTGGALFVVAGFLTIIFFGTYKNTISLILISVVPLIIGHLFLHSENRQENEVSRNLKNNKTLKRVK